MSVDIPQIQSAWVVIKRGHPNKAVVLKQDYPVPSKLKDGQVLVKASGIERVIDSYLKEYHSGSRCCT